MSHSFLIIYFMRLAFLSKERTGAQFHLSLKESLKEKKYFFKLIPYSIVLIKFYLSLNVLIYFCSFVLVQFVKQPPKNT